jgi:hypothetical protein
MSDPVTLPQLAQSGSFLNQSLLAPRRLVCLQTEPQLTEEPTDRVDESPFPIEPGCEEPPMPSDIAPEQFEIAEIVYADDRPVPDEPEAMVIGPHIAEMVYEYSLREPVMCVW